jgi:hypothetical protein
MFKNAKISIITALTVITGIVASSSAHALVPAEASAALTGISTDAGALIAEGWPVITAIVVSFVLFKIFKRIVSAAT